MLKFSSWCILNLDPCIYVGLATLQALSSLKSLSRSLFFLFFFLVVKVEMSCSRVGLSNPVLHPFQPHTLDLLLTASNWNCDHIFHNVSSLTFTVSLPYRVKWLFLSPSLSLVWHLYFSIPLQPVLPCCRVGIINCWSWHCFVFRVFSASLSPLIFWGPASPFVKSDG